jgi:hypothetical protein
MEKSDFTITGYKVFEGDEFTGFSANLRYRGKKIADVWDDGSGAPTHNI